MEQVKHGKVVATGLLAAGLATVLAVAAYPTKRQRIPRSQRASVTQRIGYTDVTITYRRPVARGRTLFGGVVSWDRVWTPGADSATTFEVTRDVQIAGHTLAAGRYSLWMIPRSQGDWIVIVSRRAGIFHVPYPGERFDVLRFEVAPTTGEHMEALAFYFPVVERTTGVLRMHWGETVIPIEIETGDDP